jgi:hypothetical protein
LQSPAATWLNVLDLLDQSVKIDPTFIRAYVERIVIRLYIFMLDYDASEFVWATQIRAWAGAEDEAADRLEALAASVPGLFPGEILRDLLLAQMKTFRVQ